MTTKDDLSAEVTAELNLLSINLRRDLAAIMPLNPTCADIVRMVIVNDVFYKASIDAEKLSLTLGKSFNFVNRRIKYLEKCGWLHRIKFTRRIKMGDLFFLDDVGYISDLNFLINQTRRSLKEMQTLFGRNNMAVA